MTISPEVKAAVDEIHRERDALKAAYDANALQGSQIADLKSQVESLKAGAKLSEEDRQALLDAISDAQQTNAALATAVPANVAPAASGASPIVEPTPPPNDPDAPRPDPIPGTGQNGTVPLMPNLAFDPAGGNKPGPADAGQPQQPAAIETAGGFVVSGGGSTQRAPGSAPDSPSSSVVVPPEAIAAADAPPAVDMEGNPMPPPAADPAPATPVPPAPAPVAPAS